MFVCFSGGAKLLSLDFWDVYDSCAGSFIFPLISEVRTLNVTHEMDSLTTNESVIDSTENIVCIPKLFHWFTDVQVCHILKPLEKT